MSATDSALASALWDLVWAGVVTNDTLAPLRAYITASSSSSTRSSRLRASAPARVRVSSAAIGASATPAIAVGRWSVVPRDMSDATSRLAAHTDVLLQRHGIITRGVVAAERTDGGWSAMLPMLQAFDERGRARRSYVVDGLGGSQFATVAAIDSIRAAAEQLKDSVGQVAGAVDAVALPATDPANPFGAALPWPSANGDGATHRPGRKAGAIVVIAGAELVLYIERGGKTVLSFTDDAQLLTSAAARLAEVVRGTGGRLVLQKADGDEVLATAARGGSALTYALESAGFISTSRGLLLR